METNHTDRAWSPLFRIGGWAAIAVLALVPFQIAVFLLWPLPDTVVGWFELYRKNPLVGLMDMDLLMIVDTVLLALMYLALYVSQRAVSPAWMLIAIALELVGVAAYLASNTAFEMLALSGRWAAADTEAQRAILVAAGETMVATWEGTAFSVSYVLFALAILITSAVMLRGRVFSRLTGWVGIVFGALSIVPASAGTPGLVLSLASLVPMWLWLALIARRLLQLARGSAAASRPEPAPRPAGLVPQH